MKQRIICKALAVTVILLFIGLAIQPSVAFQPETTDSEDDCNLCPKKVSKQHLYLINRLINIIEKYDTQLLAFFKQYPEHEKKYDELSNRLKTIKELNKNINSNTPIWEKHPIICSILFIICFIPIAIGSPATILLQFIDEVTNPILYLLASIWLLPIEIFIIIPAFLFLALGCIDFNPF